MHLINDEIDIPLYSPYLVVAFLNFGAELFSKVLEPILLSLCEFAFDKLLSVEYVFPAL